LSKNNFPKSEKLCSTKTIAELFNPPKGKKSSLVFLFPFKIVALYGENLQANLQAANVVSPARVFPQILLSVPKKSFKQAVDRNRIKRQIREIYRTSKVDIIEKASPKELPYAIAFIFVAKELQDFEFMKKRLQKAFLQLLRNEV
jgi:ribonuclease P protein component